MILATGEKIECTPEHPFYAAGRGFVEAKDLGIGTSIVTRAGPAVQVASVERHDAPATVYNFVVEDTHTYFVGTANGGVEVHNGPCFKSRADVEEYFYKNYYQNEEGTVWNNSTDWHPMEAKSTFTESGQYHYHWDNAHLGEKIQAPHLQMHFPNGDITRLYYNVP